MMQWIFKHEFWAAVGAYWVFSAAVSSMPPPSANSAAGYVWIYRFLHTLAGNVTTVFGNKIPGVTASVLTVVLAAMLVVPVSGCATHYLVHPGSLSTDDSGAYDALLIAQATIDQARTSLQAGQLPGTAKDPLNALINAYNLAHASWLTYRGALATNVPSAAYLSQLTQNLTDLTNAILAFKGVQNEP